MFNYDKYDVCVVGVGVLPLCSFLMSHVHIGLASPSTVSETILGVLTGWNTVTAPGMATVPTISHYDHTSCVANYIIARSMKEGKGSQCQEAYQEDIIIIHLIPSSSTYIIIIHYHPSSSPIINHHHPPSSWSIIILHHHHQS